MHPEKEGVYWFRAYGTYKAVRVHYDPNLSNGRYLVFYDNRYYDSTIYVYTTDTERWGFDPLPDCMEGCIRVSYG